MGEEVGANVSRWLLMHTPVVARHLGRGRPQWRLSLTFTVREHFVMESTGVRRSLDFGRDTL